MLITLTKLKCLHLPDSIINPDSAFNFSRPCPKRVPYDGKNNLRIPNDKRIEYLVYINQKCNCIIQFSSSMLALVIQLHSSFHLRSAHRISMLVRFFDDWACWTEENPQTPYSPIMKVPLARNCEFHIVKYCFVI